LQPCLALQRHLRQEDKHGWLRRRGHPVNGRGFEIVTFAQALTESGSFENEGGDPSNAGLENARAFLEPIKQAHPWITYADLYTFAGVVAIEEMGGPKIEWRPGRSDYADDTRYPGRGRLPDGAQGSDHLRAVFTDALGFNDQEIVALSGAHALGRCHSDRSGFDGPWVVNPTRFSNNYFKMLVNLDWQPRQWDGPFQYHNEELGESLMMLPTDKALCEDPALKPWVERYAKDKELFFDHFAKAFATLLELGVRRDKHPATPLDHELPHLRSKL